MNWWKLSACVVGSIVCSVFGTLLLHLDTNGGLILGCMTGLLWGLVFINWDYPV